MAREVLAASRRGSQGGVIELGGEKRVWVRLERDRERRRCYAVGESVKVRDVERGREMGVVWWRRWERKPER